MKKTFSLNAHVELQSLAYDSAYSEQAKIVRELAERELQERIKLVELDRAERFLTNEEAGNAVFVALINPSVVIGPPQAMPVPGGLTRSQLQQANLVGLYRTPEAQERHLNLQKEIEINEILASFNDAAENSSAALRDLTVLLFKIAQK